MPGPAVISSPMTGYGANPIRATARPTNSGRSLEKNFCATVADDRPSVRFTDEEDNGRTAFEVLSIM
jgi:hypothetical protein